ncbi:lipoprotein [Pseudoalteromonas mariniglutinosa]|uniref:LPS translocon maturation chaperone LptM n=1 Tax=Pseudoalteromonas mariniglutinosa TaxID=206042 RepID=UPI00384EEAEB
MKETHTLQLKKILPISLLLITLAGCGQSGPLYLPEQPAEPNQPTQQAQSANPLPSSTIESQQDQ